MENLPKAIPAIESFLKELQRIDVIKDYSLQPLQINRNNFQEFESVVKTFTQGLNDMLACHKKDVEKTALKFLNVKEDSNKVSQMQMAENKSRGSNSKNNVQLQVDEAEIQRRIAAFKSRKRKEVDEWNVQEFCSRPYVDEQNPIWEHVDSCARVDAVFIPRFGSKSHVKVSRVENRWGPQTQFQSEPAKRIKVETETDGITEQKDIAYDAILERLRNMEEHLNIKSDSSNRNKIFQRLKQLEDRILFLEGLSPDYFNANAPNFSSPKKSIHEKEKIFSTWSKEDIKKRIKVLEESLRAKSAAKKQSSF